MGLVEAFLSFKGRLNRAGYAIVLAIYLILLGVFFVTETSLRGSTHTGDLFDFALVILLLWILFAAMAKRFHDIDKTGWACLLILFPIVGQFTPIVLLFYPGNENENNFGPPVSLF